MSYGAYQIKEAARLGKVTVRTLHYYEEIGLLVPSKRTDAGYRLYTDDDLRRLQQIRLHKTLGFPLQEIRTILDDPEFDRREALIMQRERITEELDRHQAPLRSIDAALKEMDMTENQEKVDLAEIFDGFDPEEYEDEARERWGSTDAYAESARRAKQYGKSEWSQIKAEAEAVTNDMAELLKRGRSAQSDEARAVAERHRLHIDRWFYPCSHEMHAGLARMYTADERFAANFEKVAPGLAAFFSEAVLANSKAE